MVYYLPHDFMFAQIFGGGRGLPFALFRLPWTSRGNGATTDLGLPGAAYERNGCREEQRLSVENPSAAKAALIPLTPIKITSAVSEGCFFAAATDG